MGYFTNYIKLVVFGLLFAGAIEIPAVAGPIDRPVLEMATKRGVPALWSALRWGRSDQIPSVRRDPRGLPQGIRNLSHGAVRPPALRKLPLAIQLAARAGSGAASRPTTARWAYDPGLKAPLIPRFNRPHLNRARLNTTDAPIPIPTWLSEVELERQAYELLEMDSEFVGEEKKGVVYLDSDELSFQELTVAGGNLVYLKRDPWGGVRDLELKEFQRDMVITDQMRIFIMPEAKDGRLLRHSSLTGAMLNGVRRKLIWAGSIGLDSRQDGVKVVLTNLSGHFLPKKVHLDQAITLLDEMGLENVEPLFVPTALILMCKQAHCVESMTIPELRWRVTTGGFALLP